MVCSHCERVAVSGLGLCLSCFKQDKKTKRFMGNAKVRNSIVYAWIHPDGAAFYVGRGSTQRAESHKAYSSWWTPELILITMTCDNEWHSIEWEGKWGNRLKPIFNRDGNRK